MAIAYCGNASADLSISVWLASMPPVRACDSAAIPQFCSKDARGITPRAISLEACQ